MVSCGCKVVQSGVRSVESEPISVENSVVKVSRSVKAVKGARCECVGADGPPTRAPHRPQPTADMDERLHQKNHHQNLPVH